MNNTLKQLIDACFGIVIACMLVYGYIEYCSYKIRAERMKEPVIQIVNGEVIPCGN